MILWTFRRNENDVVNLYNTLSPVMQLATGGDMLNFGYWEDNDMSPITAQNRLCDITGSMAELDSAKSLLDIGSGLSSPAMKWSSLYPNIEISCVNINYDQLQAAKNLLKEKSSYYQICGINSTSTMLPFAKNSIDRIIALESAQHFKPFKHFIFESNRIIKKNGILTFAIPVTTKNTNLKNLGILTFTWSSEHYSKDFIINTISEKFHVVEKIQIGSHVFEPLADYYIKNRKKLRRIILMQYPTYVENILFKSILKMKSMSREKVIDYLLIKCLKI
jgi:cyclopropane fatty-acyl-phospholipid synthase-like methyltransferase